MLTLARISAGRVLGCRQLVLRGAAGRMFATDERPTMLASIQKAPVSQNLLLRQLFDRETCTYTYLLADVRTGEGVLLDPVAIQVERDVELIKELGVGLKYAVNTHHHSERDSCVRLLDKALPECRSIVSAASGADADIKVRHGDIISFGKHRMEVRATPGHTAGCMTCIIHEEGVGFTGDALLIRGCGRTSFAEGNPETLYESIFNQIFSLPDYFRLYPGHDYYGRTVTTVLEEKRFNPRLTRGKQEFVQLMNTLRLQQGQRMGLYKLPPYVNGSIE